ncbi:MAG: TRAFs-binding domain-containing protein, partial [Betaproteobacteria bacterium]
AMPFGVKPGADGQPIDFNRVYSELLKPALEDAGFDVFRADEEQRGGDIRTDMFQELLVADLVIADLTLDNPNVWYELGVRHALRARGVVLVQGPRASQPFDIYTDRKLNYRLKAGAPDPAFVEADRAALAAMASATLAASSRRKVSPVYVLLSQLGEPPWRDLLIGGDNEFAAAYEQWHSRMEVARQKNCAGDILVLADETPIQPLWLEAKRDAGICLLKSQQFAFALEQFDAALASDSDDKLCREKKAICLGRLQRYEEARELTRQLTADHPTDPEVWALAGRVEKDRWISRWRIPANSTPQQMRDAASLELASLEEAIAAYQQAFIADPSHHYSGVNALTLNLLLRHLGGEADQTVIDNLTGGVRWAALSEQKRKPRDYWARASHAELCLLNSKSTVVREYRQAVAAANGDWFALASTCFTLTLLRDLEFHLEDTTAALEIMEREIARLTPPFVPRQVLLFSGHLVDAPERASPRFPAAKVPLARAAIEKVLDELGAGAGDLALTQGAAGGDLLFVEACAARGVRVQLLLPLSEPAFIDMSILPVADGETWRARYFQAKSQLVTPLRVMPVELGPTPQSGNEFERCNRWLLYTALAWGPQKVRFICLWNGEGGDGPGGTRHMFQEIRRRTGHVSWIDVRTL